MEVYPISKARKNFAEIMDSVIYGGKTVFIRRRKQRVAVISIEKLQQLQRHFPSHFSPEDTAALEAH